MTRQETKVENRYCGKIFQSHRLEVTTHYINEDTDNIPSQIRYTYKCLTPQALTECSNCENNPK